MIERQVSRDCLQPATGGGATLQIVKMIVSTQKHFLGNVLGLRRVPEQSGRCGIDHVLIRVHKFCELCRTTGLLGWGWHLSRVSMYLKHLIDGKVTAYILIKSTAYVGQSALKRWRPLLLRPSSTASPAEAARYKLCPGCGVN